MLRPDYFNGKEDRLLEIYRKLEDYILKDTARRLLRAGIMTGSADRLIYIMKQLGMAQNAIYTELQRYTGMSGRVLRSILQDAVLTSWADDQATYKRMGIEISSPLDNPRVISVMDAEYKKTRGELKNLTRTTMTQAYSDLKTLMDDAEVRIASGAESYNSAINDVLDSYAGRGIVVEYPTGTRRTLESAVRCCVVTGMNQTAGQVTNQYVVEAGTEYIRVSAHAGARYTDTTGPENHLNWQGKVYKLRGSEDGYPNLLESTGYDIDPVTGEGRVVDPRGLHGYNCRHSHQPWDKALGQTSPDNIDTEESKKLYDLSQSQRKMERAIRATKRKITVKEEELKYAEDKDKAQAQYDKLKKKLTDQNKAYNDFCKENNLTAQYDRLRTA